MSMLSAQVDELRELATRYDELQVGAAKAVTMPSDMGSVLREAADAIWELRCKLSDMVDMRERARVAEAENEKLRETLQRRTEQFEGMTEMWVERGVENANLRELATYALRYIVDVWCEGEGRDLYRGKPCEDCVDAGSSDCPKCMPRVFDVSGIEVDE